MGIHPISNANQTLEPIWRQMFLSPHRVNDVGKGCKILTLDHWGISFEERQHCCLQLTQSVDSKCPNTAVGTFGANSPTAEDRNHGLENISMIVVLVDVEDRLELPPAVSPHHRRTMHRHGEATFAVHKPNDPVGIEHEARTGSFLLIVRTGRIFTIHMVTQTDGCHMDEYRRILGCSSI